MDSLPAADQLPTSMRGFTPEQLAEVAKWRNQPIALVLQLKGYKLLEHNFTYRDYEMCEIICLILIDLYIFELLYRPVMRLPLIAHHFTTIGLVIYGTYIIKECQNLDLFTLALILLFQASTEQLTFLGLFFYRIKPSWSSPTLFFAAVQVFIVKFATLIWCYVFWGKYLLPNKDGKAIVTGFNVVFPIGGLILFGTQLWSTYVVWVIAKKAHQNTNANAQRHDVSEKKLEEGADNSSHPIDSNNASTIVN
ncbi:9739_t:CDS:2 [Ambispora gerdemannii]|uniref:9739_t:CDS:1 n=1 Tax=Ambispora gerdemannii TaxID=144530 RepID=A0A9N9H285_9GLOM|nr:9739_t:CDS:2 [Ambispora gerdemannii]